VKNAGIIPVDTMDLRVPTHEDLISILDRVLDKSIVVESWITVGLQGIDLRVADARPCVAESSVYLGYGETGSWHELHRLDLFPFWRRDLWTK
jgi:Gas vesicle protein